MMNAYDEVYLYDAQTTMASMLDVAVNSYSCKLNSFYDLFLESEYAEKFGKGDPNIISGLSGAELTHKVFDYANKTYDMSNLNYDAYSRSDEYWTGWVLAYYQWKTGFSFYEINQFADIEYIFGLYNPFHEMDIIQLVDKVNEKYITNNPDTNLKRRRMEIGLSQSELALYTKIPIRTIQQYEQRQKNINRARADYLLSFSNALGCPIEALIERVDIRTF